MPKVLVVDDDPVNRRFAVETLSTERYQVITAQDGAEALEKLRDDPPDLLLLDVVMPKMNGLEVCRIVKSLHTDVFVPVIMVTVRGDVESKITGLKVGADDYVAKPYNPLELRARVSSMLRIKALQDRVNARRKELEALSVTDELTGLLNHRAMQQRLREEFARAQRYNQPLSVLMIDIDYFKQINDRFGHQFGDQVLSQVGKLLQGCVRQVDVLARYGGEEFLAILPETHFTGSLTVADRMWRGVGATVFSHGHHTTRTSISVGISFFPHKDTTRVEQLIAQADEALYEAKDGGRNRICLHKHLSFVYRPEGQSP